jgi:integrase
MAGTSARGKDLHQIDGGWYVAIGLDRQSAKTGSSRRRVPLHRALIAEGFLAYAQTKGGNERLFSSWAGDNVSKWVKARSVSRTKRKVRAIHGGIVSRTKGARQASRRTFATLCRAPKPGSAASTATATPTPGFCIGL